MNATFIHTVYDNAGNQVSSEEKTVAQYYRDRYNYVLKYPNMPLIQVAPAQKNIFIPMELLLIHDKPQRLRNKLPDDVQGLTNAFTSRLPRDRFWDIHDMMEDIEVQNDPFLRDARVEVNPKFLEIQGRVLPQPNCKFTVRNPRDQLAQKPENTVQKKVAFSLISINNAINFNDETQECFNNLIADCSARGMQVCQMPGGRRSVEVLQYRFDRQNLSDYILDRKRKAEEVCGRDVEFVLVCIVGTAGDMIYNAFKTECEIYHGVMSQFMLRKTFLKLRDRPQLQNSVTRNIFLKLNAKTGGVNNYVPANFNGWNKFTNAKEPTLFIGIDVTHPAPGDSEFPSISAVVGNIDVMATKYTASVRTQFSRTEGIDIDVMAEMCEERIRSFQDANRGQLPKHIVMFRDGVSESQFEQVLNFELKGLKKACIKLGCKPPDVTLTVLIVQKRHSTRFYAPQVDGREQHPGVNKGNPPPGTVVDRYITTADPKLKEFYLCAHRGMLGTSRPVHYFVLFDTWKLTADDIQVCSYSLCYLFARAPMSVSLPAPVFYAHLCCYRARRHFSDQRDAPDRPTGNEAYQRMVRVHDQIKPRMYFC
ncbi:piwi domain-containing protein [Ditylenchus destructor]|uniref:Piwi domain-containing protein n=1 Tax=Ditylenchus destructor TaxID=166010 RepID=A0AAD4MP14_9BILA|nr:piwi domain-containing protein [Ditylenchus destructor]